MTTILSFFSALEYLFDRAYLIKQLVVLGKVLAEVGAPDNYSEMSFTKERLLHSFSDNPFNRLDLYEVVLI